MRLLRLSLFWLALACRGLSQEIQPPQFVPYTGPTPLATAVPEKFCCRGGSRLHLQPLDALRCEAANPPVKPGVSPTARARVLVAAKVMLREAQTAFVGVVPQSVPQAEQRSVKSEAAALEMKRGRRGCVGRCCSLPKAFAGPTRWSFSATQNPGAGRDLTVLAAVVQLPLRVRLGCRL